MRKFHARWYNRALSIIKYSMNHKYKHCSVFTLGFIEMSDGNWMIGIFDISRSYGRILVLKMSTRMAKCISVSATIKLLPSHLSQSMFELFIDNLWSIEGLDTNLTQFCNFFFHLQWNGGSSKRKVWASLHIAARVRGRRWTHLCHIWNRNPFLAWPTENWMGSQLNDESELFKSQQQILRHFHNASV